MIGVGSNSQESAVTTTVCGSAESGGTKTGRGGTVQANPPSPEALFAGRSLGELAGEEFNDTVLARENPLVRMKTVAKDSESTMAEEVLAEELRLEIEYPRGQSRCRPHTFCVPTKGSRGTQTCVDGGDYMCARATRWLRVDSCHIVA